MAELVLAAIEMVEKVAHHAEQAQRNGKFAKRLADRATVFEPVLRSLKAMRLTEAQHKGVELLTEALHDGYGTLKQIEKRGTVAAIYNAARDQAMLKVVWENLDAAGNLLQVANQVDEKGFLEALKTDTMQVLQEQNKMGIAVHQETQRQLDELKRMMMQQQRNQPVEDVMAQLEQTTLAVGNDPSLKATDLGVQSKEAYVVGVKSYEAQPLGNSVNDAEDIAASLARCGFRVRTALDPTLEEFDEGFEVFESRLGPGTLAVFYFSGHGCEYDGQNYLLMRDLPAGVDDKKLARYGITAESVLRSMTERHAGFHLLILDACRSVRVKRSTRLLSNGGLKKMEPPPLKDAGSVIAYSTSPDSVAFDASENGETDSRNGLYTKHLLGYLEKPVPVRDMLEEVQFAVQEACGRKQVPWINSHFGNRAAKKLQLVDGTVKKQSSSRRGLFAALRRNPSKQASFKYDDDDDGFDDVPAVRRTRVSWVNPAASVGGKTLNTVAGLEGKYAGDLVKKKAEGNGTWTGNDGSRYVGEFKDDKRNGQGILTQLDGHKYIGEFRNDVKHGHGTGTDQEGNEFVGNYNNDKPNGKGTYTFANGTRYVGDFKDGKFHGTGTFFDANGNTIVSGQWKDGECVKDTYKQENEKKKNTGTKHLAVWNYNCLMEGTYSGELGRDGKANGRGVWVANEDGRRYVGEWRGDKMNGQGHYAFADGSKYKGQFRDGKYHGQGDYRWPDGEGYVGAYRDDKRNGYGTYTRANGEKYVGEWKDDKRHGKGTKYDAYGYVVQCGKWKDHAFIEAELPAT